MQIINYLADKIKKNQPEIAEFFSKNFIKYPELFYNSIDLRHNQFKISAIDTNCFPAGFNNLSSQGIANAQKIWHNFLTNYIAQNNIDINKNINLFIIPENHTRNIKYFASLATLIKILSSDKTTVYLASFNPELLDPITFETENNSKITIHPLEKINQKLTIKNTNIVADLSILNNDLTSGIPAILQECSTPIIPSINMGWFHRKKSQHFDHYNNLSLELASLLKIDPWLISSYHSYCQDLDFKNNLGLENLANIAENLLNKISKKYQEYNIPNKPYCFIKAENGTYGMGVWAIESPNDILTINKKERNKMNILKGSVENHQVIIQEGILTTDKINNHPSEPLIYMLQAQIIELLYRCNQNRNELKSLNSPGAEFYNSSNLAPNNFMDKDNNFGLVCEFIAKIASLASSIENKNFNL